MGHQVGVVFVTEVVLQDDVDQEGLLGVSGIGGVFEVVLAIAAGVIEQAACGRVEEAVGLLQGVEVDDRHLLEHLVSAAYEAADVYRQKVIAPLFSDVRGYEVGGQIDRKDVFGGILDLDLDRANANLSEGLNHYNQEMRAEIFDVLKKAYVEYENEILERRKYR